MGCGDNPFLPFCALRGTNVQDIDENKVAAMSKRLEDSPARLIKALVCDACSLPIADASATKLSVVGHKHGDF